MDRPQPAWMRPANEATTSSTRSALGGNGARSTLTNASTGQVHPGGGALDAEHRFPGAAPAKAFSQPVPFAKTDDGNVNPLGPTPSVPKSGGGISSMNEKFSVHPNLGSSSLSIPIPAPGLGARVGVYPSLSLSYDSGSGSGSFGIGWSLGLGSITRKSEKGIPTYNDNEDIFILSGVEDLVPELRYDESNKSWAPTPSSNRTTGAVAYTVRRFRPRIESGFAVIEQLTSNSNNESHWRVVSGANITTTYGTTRQSRISNPADPTQISTWLLDSVTDDTGSRYVATYKAEDSTGVIDAQGVPIHLHESSRTPKERSTNKYLKAIKYGNSKSTLSDAQTSDKDRHWMFEVVLDYGEHDELSPRPDDDGPWKLRRDPFSSRRAGFELRTYRLCQRILVFHHFPDEPEVGASCLVKGLELSYRDDLPDEDPHLGSPRGSLLSQVRLSCYKRKASSSDYNKVYMPPINFSYTPWEIEHNVRTVPSDVLTDMPCPGDGSSYQFADLHGEGIPGILINDEPGAWLYKEPLGEATYGPATRVPRMPSLASFQASLAQAASQLLDIDGDGIAEFVDTMSACPGFSRIAAWEPSSDSSSPPPATPDGVDQMKQTWEPFMPFESFTNTNFFNQDLSWVDLTGNGAADLLIPGDMALEWHPSKGARGLGPLQSGSFYSRGDGGVKPIFSLQDHAVVTFADMTGDGLADLVQITDRGVSYHPNLGYCRFGNLITMDNPPQFGFLDAWDPLRVRLADVDGTGPTDLIYLSGDGAKVFMNESGNSWSKPIQLPAFPSAEAETGGWSRVQVIDLLGAGTACLAWTSSLGSTAQKKIQFINLSKTTKPNILKSISNGFGATTKIEYASSVKFSLADKAAGRRWRTTMPFPVQVVERSSMVDSISRTYGSSTFSYHHGFYDANGGSDREFRGFARVEVRDTEAFASLHHAAQQEGAAEGIDKATHMPPILTKTWFHLGAWLGSRGGVYSNYLASEYFSGTRLLGDAPPPALFSTEHGDPLAAFAPTAEEYRQMSRCLKGAVLRQEVYAEDGAARQTRPYTITENSFSINAYQPSANPYESGHSWAVFMSIPRETVTVSLEREPILLECPIMHSVCLETDYFGSERKKAVIAYGRRGAISDDDFLSSEDIDEMRRTYVTVNETGYTNSLPEATHTQTSLVRRHPSVFKGHTYQLFNMGVPADSLRPLFTFDEVWSMVRDAESRPEIPFSDYNGSSRDASHTYRRPLSHTEFLYRRDDLGGSLPPGIIESRAVIYEGYRKAIFAGDIQQALVDSGKLSRSELEQILINEGRYVHVDDDDWWIPSGRGYFSPQPLSPDQELAFAEEHFFLPHRYVNPFDRPEWSTAAHVTYDKYKLLTVESVDALGNKVTAGERDLTDPNEPLLRSGLDYRVLNARVVMSPNGNRKETRFDTLGMAAGCATMGKPGEDLGDTLDDFVEDLSEAVVARFFRNPTEPGLAAGLLKGASSRSVCDINAYYRNRPSDESTPSVVAVITREIHAKDPGGEVSPLHISLSYSNGLCQGIQAKALVDPGPLDNAEGDGGSHANPRWLSSPWGVFNNKGLPVQLFEPFYTGTHNFEFNVRLGTPSTTFYDPLERPICELNADHSWSKTAFRPWHEESWDANDTAGISDPQHDLDVGGYFRKLPDEPSGEPSSLYWPTWYAQRANGGLGGEEKEAAEKTMAHANTPSTYFHNAIGQCFLSAAQNIVTSSQGMALEALISRASLDVQGLPHSVTDARGRQVGRAAYDMAGRVLTDWDMEKGRNWSLLDIEGKAMYSWNERGDRFSTTFDQLARSTDTFVLRSGTTIPLLINRYEYGEDEPVDIRARGNLRGQCVRQYDTAGLVEHLAFDFKGNLVEMRRTLASDYKNDIDWSNRQGVKLMATSFVGKGVYDAMNRQTETTLPDSTLIRQEFNRQDQVIKAFVTHPGTVLPVQYIHDVQLDAKGQRKYISYGDGTGAKTSYHYDKLTSRLRSVVTRRPTARFPGDAPDPPDSSWPGKDVQNLHYCYDAVGNVTSIRDDAQQSIFFNGVRVDPSQEFVYDALYRLTEATGREHLSSTFDAFDRSVTRLPHPHDGRAMGRYTQRYAYDKAGNILKMQHAGGPTRGWTREYTYAETVQNPGLNQPVITNRLSSTSMGGVVSPYTYDVQGNMTSIPHLSRMRWDYTDKLRHTSSQRVENGGTPETTYYVYDGYGQRIRKVTERYAPEGGTPTIKSQKMYFGTLEISEEFSGAATDPENPSTRTRRRTTTKIDDGPQRLVTVDTDEGTGTSVARYQLSNHIGSCSVELDDQFRVLTYEEYTPFGSTSYQGVADPRVPAKISRFLSQERDEESGFYVLGARCYMPWLGRFINADPAGFQGGVNLYAYASNNPIVLADPSGLAPDKPPPQYTGDYTHTAQGAHEGPWKGDESPEDIRASAKAQNIEVGEFQGWAHDTGTPVPVFSYVREITPGTPSNGGSAGAGGAATNPAETGGAADPGGATGGSPGGVQGGSLEGSDGGSPAGTPGGGPGEGAGGPGGSGSPSQETNPHGSWWDRGGGTLVGAGFAALGAIAAIAIILTAVTPVGWFALATAAMLTSTALAGAALGAWQLSTSGRRTAAENRELSADINSGLSLFSTPVTLGAGLAGAALGGREGMDKATFVAGLAQAGGGLLKGVGRAVTQTLKFGSILRANPGMTRQQALFRLFGTEKVGGKYAPGTVRTTTLPWVHPKMIDPISNSHWASRDWAKKVLSSPWGQKVVARLGTTVEKLVDKLWHPLNIKPMWKSVHLRLDSAASGAKGTVVPRLNGFVQHLLRPPTYVHEVAGGAAGVQQTKVQHSFGN